jgi:hypothetical protein
MSLANPECPHCSGGGLAGQRDATASELAGGAPARVSIVCRCVVEHGGVKPDSYDKSMQMMSRQLADGSYARTAAGNISRLPPEQRQLAVQRLTEQVLAGKGTPDVREALRATLALVRAG